MNRQKWRNFHERSDDLFPASAVFANIAKGVMFLALGAAAVVLAVAAVAPAAPL